jgi:catechol 2,3-dioxygenase-like lactoylglutathione lyase family enzyme
MRIEIMETLIDHVFITVKDLDRSIAFYETALKPLGIEHAIDYDGKNGPEGHPDLKGFGRDGRVFFWLRQGDADASVAHIGFVAKGEAEVNAFYEAAMAAGATDNGKPSARQRGKLRACRALRGKLLVPRTELLRLLKN